MMSSFQSLKDELRGINRGIAVSIQKAVDLPGAGGETFETWEAVCRNIDRQMTEEVIRVAVVGAIKSGKSTFVNSIFKEDYLKRGAGVVTSIVTRVRSGPYLKATLFFKSWDEVNAEMQQAITLFPASRWQASGERFDIRRQTDRDELAAALGTLNSDLLISQGSRNVNSIILESYLEGHDRVKSILDSEHLTEIFEDDNFAGHKDFVGSDTLAVYLKDIELEVNNGSLDTNIEIADCQGSDSPNPLHLAKIQEYLVKAHLLIYVISSRTGLRQADIRFLSMIKQMGIMENIVFIINCDFSEHDGVDDLEALVKRSSHELAMLRPQPEVYSISSLYNLFQSKKGRIPEKDALRLAQWEKETSLRDYSNQESERFFSAFGDKLARERSALLLTNNMERLDVVATGLMNWVKLNRSVVNRDQAGVERILEKIGYHRTQMGKIESLIKSTLDGSVQKVKKELKVNVDRFFDARSGETMKRVVDYIRNYQVSTERYEESLEASGFTDTLFLVFQDFKESLDGYMAEQVNPRIIRFVRDEEERIATYLESVAGPYVAMVREAVTDYNQEMADLGIPTANNHESGSAKKSLSASRQGSELILPPIDATMRYTARIKTEAIVKLGAYSVVKIFRKLMKKDRDGSILEKTKALKDGVKRMKRETERSVLLHLKDYRENIKFQSMFKLTDIMSEQLYRELLQSFEAYFTDISKMVELIREERIDKKGMLQELERIESDAASVQVKIDYLREEMRLKNEG